MKKKINLILFISILILLIGFIIYCIYFLEGKLKEGFQNNPPIKNIMKMQEIHKEIRDMGLEPALGFCEKYRSSGRKRERECNKLTKDNCQHTSCCVYTNNNKCVAGSNHGALFKTKNGEKIDVTTYHHYGKCYGSNCKKE